MIEKYPIDPPTKEPAHWPEPPRWPSADDCNHEYELRKLRCSNGTIQYKSQCTLCGHGTPAIAHSKLTQEQKDRAPDFDPDFQSPAVVQYYRERERYLAARTQTVELFSAEWWKWYDGYLASDVWERRRVAVLDRDNWLCQACRYARATTAHHLTYAHVGQEPLFDLIAACPTCHEDLHPGRGTS